MYCVVLECDCVPASEGSEAALEITNEFRKHREPRYTNVTCTYVDGKLVLSADNDGWDRDGLNLMDEFSDCLSAYIRAFDGDMRLVSATRLSC